MKVSYPATATFPVSSRASSQSYKFLYSNLSICSNQQASRRRKNRDSAKLSTMKKEEKFSDLLADNIALSMEYEALVKDLDNINAAKEIMNEAISSKVQEILAISVTKAT